MNHGYYKITDQQKEIFRRIYVKSEAGWKKEKVPDKSAYQCRCNYRVNGQWLMVKY